MEIHGVQDTLAFVELVVQVRCSAVSSVSRLSEDLSKLDLLARLHAGLG